MDRYELNFEISGPTAMWTHPDTGDAPVRYAAPTFTAAKGLFESIVWLNSAEVVPTKVEISSPVVWHTYTTNYGGPLRKSRVIRGGGYQMLTTVLVNVCYQLYAEIRPDSLPDAKLSDRTKAQRAIAHNSPHTKREIPGVFFATARVGWLRRSVC